MTVTDDTPDLDEQTRKQALADIEADVARRKAADAAAADTRRAPKLAGDGVETLVARIRERAQHVEPARADDVEDLDTRAQQVKARAQAWRASVDAAHQSALADWTIDRLGDDQHPTALARYVEALRDPDARIRTLILAGTIGNGKTSAAIAVGNAAVERGVFTRFVKHSTYLRWLRPNDTPPGLTAAQVRDRFRTAQLLILDDLGAELERETSDFVRQETSDLLGDRLGDGRPTVVTTNLSSEVIADALGERLISRLGARALALRFIGPDRRSPVTW